MINDNLGLLYNAHSDGTDVDVHWKIQIRYCNQTSSQTIYESPEGAISRYVQEYYNKSILKETWVSIEIIILGLLFYKCNTNLV